MISRRNFPFRNLRYHFASQFFVMLGVAVAASVLCGALIVGDSLRGSLRTRSERQLHGLGSAYVGMRLVRENSFDDPEVTPALILHGSARYEPKDGDPRRVGRVAIYGIRDEDRKKFDLPNGVVVSSRLAGQLKVEKGQTIDLGLEKMSKVPRSTLLGKKDIADVTSRTRVKIDEILSPDHPMNDFQLSPSPVPPVNIFVPLKTLQKELEIVGKVNALLSATTDAKVLNEKWKKALTLADWGIILKPKPYLGALVGAAGRIDAYKDFITIQSEQMIFDEATVAAIERATGKGSERSLTYLANAIYAGSAKIGNKDAGDAEKLMAYSIIASLESVGPTRSKLADDEIALLDWPEGPLKNLKPGDPVTIAYFLPEMEASTVEAWKTFRFAGYIPYKQVEIDRDLTPPFPGITDKPKIRGKAGEQWEAPFDINYARVLPRDDTFWENHRASPKAYISRAAGEKLFGSRFGTVTAFRFSDFNLLETHKPDDEDAEWLEGQLLKELDPNAAGFRFEPIRERMLAASKGGTDFGGMLLAFSGLLILAALLLVAMLFRFSVDKRAKEIGLLLATGYPAKTVRNIIAVEGMFVALFGATLGVALSIVYAKFMLDVLVGLWPDANIQSYLTLHVTSVSLIIGFVATMFVAMIAMAWGFRGVLKVPPPLLLRGSTQNYLPLAPAGRGGRGVRGILNSPILAIVCAILGVIAVSTGGLADNPDMRAGAFFTGGGLLMLAGIQAFRTWLQRERQPSIGITSGWVALSLNNLTRTPGRSALTVLLLALASFLLVAVETFRKKPGSEFATKTGGSGGYALLGETDIPLFRGFESKELRGEILDQLSKDYQNAEAKNPNGPSRKERLDKANETLDSLSVLPFRVRSGDDASCLNLYQAGKPRVLGIPEALLNERRFAFALTEAKTPEEKANPWLLLNKTYDDGAIPVIAEQNTVLWQLKTFVGSSITMPDDAGREVKFRIVGTLQDSVFQSELLISDTNFRKLYPREEGYRVFLIDAPPERRDEVVNLLESGLRSNGMNVTRSADLVATYQAVIGAYLTTFQLLGGFALVLGVLGYGVVIIRGIWERSGEIALLRAVGYRTGTVMKIVLLENLVLLTVGLGVGIIAATISVIPYLALGGQLGTARVTLLLVVVICTGAIVALLTTLRVTMIPVIPALRRE